MYPFFIVLLLTVITKIVHMSRSLKISLKMCCNAMTQLRCALFVLYKQPNAVSPVFINFVKILWLKISQINVSSVCKDGLSTCIELIYVGLSHKAVFIGRF